MTQKQWIYLVCIPFIATMAFAQPQEERLKAALKKYPEADTNQDGTLTAKEAMVYMAKMRQKKNPSNKLPPPTHSDVAYGSHERNVMDLWLVPSDQPTPLVVHIHGGGFVGGDKNKISPDLIKQMLDEGISVASINYRLTTEGLLAEGPNQYPAPMHDGARAIQFLRHHTATYNLDKTRFAATGGSAGACMLMWIGFHPDLAQPDHADPVLRESSRLQVLAPKGGQTTAHGPTYLEWFGVKSLNLSKRKGPLQPTSEKEPPSEEHLALGIEASPITHLTKDDPPIYLFYGAANTPVTEETLWGKWIHHPMLGIKLKEAMDALDMECHLEYRDGPAIPEYESQNDFIIKKLKALPAAGSTSEKSQPDANKWNTTGLKQANTMGGGEAPSPTTGTFRVFVLMGQSNMQGAGRAKELKAPCNEKHKRIRIWANGRWEYFVPTQRHGPGVSFAHQLADFWPDDTIGIIKVASGGTGIRGFEKDWSFERAELTFDGKKGSLYQDLMNAVAEAKRISDPEFCGFFWKQGGADGTRKVLAEEYFDTFRQLVSDLRADLNVSDLPVFIPSYMNDEELLKIVRSNMSDEEALKTRKSSANDKELLQTLVDNIKPSGKRPYIAHVIMAQNRAGREIPNVFTLYPGEMPKGADGIHFNSEGYVMLGKFTADAVEEFYKENE